MLGNKKIIVGIFIVVLLIAGWFFSGRIYLFLKTLRPITKIVFSTEDFHQSDNFSMFLTEIQDTVRKNWYPDAELAGYIMGDKAINNDFVSYTMSFNSPTHLMFEKADIFEKLFFSRSSDYQDIFFNNESKNRPQNIFVSYNNELKIEKEKELGIKTFNPISTKNNKLMGLTCEFYIYCLMTAEWSSVIEVNRVTLSPVEALKIIGLKMEDLKPRRVFFRYKKDEKQGNKIILTVIIADNGEIKANKKFVFNAENKTLISQTP